MKCSISSDTARSADRSAPSRCQPCVRAVSVPAKKSFYPSFACQQQDHNSDSHEGDRLLRQRPFPDRSTNLNPAPIIITGSCLFMLNPAPVRLHPIDMLPKAIASIFLRPEPKHDGNQEQGQERSGQRKSRIAGLRYNHTRQCASGSSP